MAAVPVALIAERRLITRLMRADAVSAAGAQRLDDLPWFQSRRLVRLMSKGVVREAQPGTYYLNAPALADHLQSRRRRVALAMAVVLALLALSMLIVRV